MRDLTPNEKALLDARLDSVIYTCGAEGLFEEGHQLEKKAIHQVGARLRPS